MKLIVKSDDYGFTKGVTFGILDGIENGFINCTGLFTNMSYSKEAADKISSIKNICFGIDINLVSGRPVSDAKLLPHLVDQKTGEFIRSGERLKDARDNGIDFWPYEECRLEAAAQIEKFKEFTGKYPAYINGHSITRFSLNFQKALSDCSVQYQIPYIKDIEELAKIKRIPSWSIRPFNLENQFLCNPEEHVLNALKAMKDEELVMISGHCGYVDEELLDYSSYTVIRARDHQMYTSKKIKNWIDEHKVELVTLSQVYEQALKGGC